MFRIELTDAVRSAELFAPLELDPLDELTEFQRGMTRFCFEHNRRIELRVADVRKVLMLYPDLLMRLDELPESIAALAAGGQLALEFPESGFNLTCRAGDAAGCTVTSYGQSVNVASSRCDPGVVVKAFRELLSHVLREAIDSGYISHVEATEFIRGLPEDRP